MLSKQKYRSSVSRNRIQRYPQGVGVPEIMPIQDETGSPRRNRDKGRLDTIVLIAILLLGFCSFLFWWPALSDYSRFAFIACFPVAFPFAYVLLRSDSFKRHKRKRLLILASAHILLLASALLLWKIYSSTSTIRDPDFVFGVMAVDMVIAILATRGGGSEDSRLRSN